MRDGPKTLPKNDWQMDAGTDSAASKADEEYQFPTSRGVLSAEEIEALLRPKTASSSLEIPEPQSIEPRQTPQFQTPVRAADAEHERAAQVLASRLAMALGTGAGIKAAFAVAETAEIDRANLPGLMQGKSSAVACIGPSETEIHALICLPPLLADAIIAKACGARGSTGRIGDGWTLSAIDCALLDQLLAPLGPAVSADYAVQAIETDVPYVTSLLPSNEIAVSEFSVEAPGVHSELAVLQTKASTARSGAATPVSAKAPVTAVMTARLASLSVPLSRLTELKAGSTLLLGLPADQPVELLSGDRDGEVAFEGQMGRKGNKVAIKLTKRMRSFSEG